MMVKQFKIRCSAIGKIMTNPRKKSETLSATAKTYCEEWLKEQLYDRKKQFSNKYTQKGLVMEDNSLDFIAEQFGYGLLIKNEEYFENDFLTGTPDIILEDHLIDVKNSWDAFTFPLFNEVLPSKDYYYQAQGYMALTGRTKYKVIYTLMNTPEYLIEKEFQYNNFYDKDYEDFKKDYLFDNIPAELRKKEFFIEADFEVIEQIKLKVQECQSYINELLEKIK